MSRLCGVNATGGLRGGVMSVKSLMGKDLREFSGAFSTLAASQITFIRFSAL
jgi:hypothetical protein